METDQVGRLRDIQVAARLIGTYVKGTTETDFHNDKQKQDAVKASTAASLCEALQISYFRDLNHCLAPSPFGRRVG